MIKIFILFTLFFTGISPTHAETWQEVKNKAEEAQTAIAATAQAAWEAGKNSGRAILENETIKDSATKAQNQVEEQLEQTKETTQSTWSEAKDKASDTLSWAEEKLKQARHALNN